jgi:hypothetical protein
VKAALPALALLALAACAATPEQVAARCEREAASSTTVGVGGEFALGYASDRGFVNDSSLALSAGVNLGSSPRDPRVAYEDCVRERTGQGPVRPFGAS